MTDTRHVLTFRRKREGRTNYKKRLALLKSAKRRLIIRMSNKHLQLQIIEYQPSGDRVLLTVNSKALLKHGWTHSTKSTPAAYCIGFILGKEALKQKIDGAIVDLGLERHHDGGRVCAAIKGAIDAGLNIPAGEEIFPSPERLRGEHLTTVKKDELIAFMTTLGIKLPEGSSPKKEKKLEDDAKGKGEKRPTMKKVIAEQRPDKVPHADKAKSKKKGE